MEESNKPLNSIYNQASQGGVLQTKTRLYSEIDLKKAFSYYAFSSISNMPYDQKELDQEFHKFKKTL